MTVTSASYSSIEEAWADSYLNPTIQKKSKRPKSHRATAPPPPPPDPICDLYEMGHPNQYPPMGHEDSELAMFANNYYEKARYQKPRMQSREPQQPKTIHLPPDDLPTAEEEDLQEALLPMTTPQRDVELERLYERALPMEPKRSERFYEYYDSDGGRHPDSFSGFNTFDVALYILSGILLIFMMEQFVKIGMLLH